MKKTVNKAKIKLPTSSKKYLIALYAKRTGLILLGALILFISVFYSVGRWYQQKHANDPLVIGATFIPGYARYFELEPRETLEAIINDLDIKHLRLVSYWSEHEKIEGQYDFSDLDWQFELAERYGAKVTLALGLRQPRWPECHAPGWTESLDNDVWIPRLYDYIQAVVNRYKSSPALESYQLENEFFLTAFTRCRDNSRWRLEEEYRLVRNLDQNHPISMNLSSDVGVSVGEPTPDLFGMTLYQRVYESRFLNRYIDYPYPSWMYAGRAGFQDIVKGKPSFIHELQAEPWGPVPIKQMTVAEQNESMDAERLHNRMQYAMDTGIRRMDLWGAEWWYWRKIKMGDSSLWDVIDTFVDKCSGTINTSQCLDKDL